MTILIDEAFEDVLRRVLLEARPSVDAGPALRERVRRVPGKGRSMPVNQWLAMAARLAAVFVVVAVAALAVAVVSPSTKAPNAGSPTAPIAVPAFDPTADGVGMVPEGGDALRKLPPLAAGVLAVVLIVLAWRRGRVWRVATAAVVVAALAAAQFISSHPGLSFYNAYGAPLGIEIERAPSLTNGPDAFHITAEPSENFIVTFNVANVGSVPVRVLGIVDRSRGERRLARWSAVGIQTDAHGGFGSLDEARPLEPFDLGPQQVVNLFVVGRAGACAVGNTGTPDGGEIGMRGVELAFSVLGMSASDELELPFVLGEAQREGCDPFPDTTEVLAP